MKEQITQRDRSKWGAGPWDSEPDDKTQWIDEATGLDCLAVRNHAGAWCGYVGLPATHPLHGKDYSADIRFPSRDGEGLKSMEAAFSVHGGITYASACSGEICHVPEDGRPDDVWWIGFDCAHSGDLAPMDAHYDMLRYRLGGTYRNLHYVKSECAQLAEQLSAYATFSEAS